MQKNKKKDIATNTEQQLAKTDAKLLDDIRILIEQTCERFAQTVNSSLVLMNLKTNRINLRKVLFVNKHK